MDLESLRKLAAEHPYVLLALIIGLIVRLLKSDTKLPLNVPPTWRRPLAMLLAVAGAAIERVAMNVPIGQAFFDAIVAWAIAEFGHYFLIDKLRDGKELPLPFLMVPGASPSPGKPPSIPPAPKSPTNIPPGITGVLVAIFLFAAITFLQACIPVKDPSDAKSKTLTVIQTACVIANAFLPDQKTVMKACQIADQFGPTVADLILAQKKASVSRGDGKVGNGEAKPVCISGDELVACSP